MADTQVSNDKRAAEEARLYKDDRILYEVASGPMFNTAYVFGVCILMEMQWMHSYPIEAAEFFHGPFEIVDQNTPMVLMLGEDPSRPLMERVVRFCKKYTERLVIYDSKDFEMKGIDPAIRAIVAPYILEAALVRIAQRLAVWHNQPLSTRRYMWKTEY
jgi:fructoselysine 6-phosphate deglycase